MPAFAGPSLDVLARDGRVKFDHRFAAFDRRVGASGNDYARLNETVPRIGALQSLDAQARRREMQIADGMRRLHRRDDAEFFEAGNIERIHNLRVLNAPARICNLSLTGR